MKFKELFGLRLPGPKAIKETALLYPGVQPLEKLKQEGREDLKRIVWIISGAIILSMIIAVKKDSLQKGLIAGILGIIGACAVPALRIQNRSKKIRERKEQLELSFSELTSKLSILMGAGLSLRNSWEKMVADYRKTAKPEKGTENYLFEEMEFSLRMLSQGISENEMLERFGERIGIPCYLRLVSLLQSNRRNGGEELIRALRIESREAFELRLATARRKGEKLGTKMLIPMIVLFALVLVVLIVPAFMSW